MRLYRHVKTGRVYAVLIENAVSEGTQIPCVVYQGVDEDTVWIRAQSEFFDGRFVKIMPRQIEAV